MSSAQSPGAYNTAKISSKSSWIDGNNNTIFEGRDQVINTLNGTSSEAEISEILEGGGLNPEEKEKPKKSQMVQASPFGNDSYDITHEVVTSDNIDTSHAEVLLKDEKGKNDLIYDEEGEIYNMSVHEFFRHPDSTRTGKKGFDRVDRNNLEEVDEDIEVLTIHTVIYEKPSGSKYLVHWDPGKRMEGGKKKKFVEKEGEPSLEAKRKKTNTNFFEDYTNYKLDEGLGQISETLHSIKNEFYREADRKKEKNSAGSTEPVYSEEVREKVWKAERWRAMADAVESFKLSYKSEKPVSKQISYQKSEENKAV